jgi:superfamily I DNA/RNA helicase
LNAIPGLAEILDPRYTLLRDDLGPGLFARLCGQARFPARLDTDQVQAVRRILYPEVSIPMPAIAQLPLLDLDQEQIAKSYLDAELVGDGQTLVRDLTARLVRGVVGSGKSLILLYRARYLAEVNESWQIAILTFNRSLGGHLRRKAQALGVPMERVRIQNFHAWARGILEEAHSWPTNLVSGARARSVLRKAQQTVPESKAFPEEFLIEEIQWLKGHRVLDWDRYKSVPRVGRGVGLNVDQRAVVFKLLEAYRQELSNQGAHDWEDVPLLILDGIERGQIQGGQYHAILIDEAQDFWPSWFQVTLKMLRPETNMLFLVADTAQKIYRSAFSWKELGIELRGKRVRILKRSYRNTSEILQTAYAIIRDEEFLREEDGFVSTPELNHPASGHGPLPIILAKDDSVQELGAIVTELKRLREIGYAYRDILLTTFRRDTVERMVRALAAAGIQAVAVDDHNWEWAKDAVTVSTLHSAKGMEYRVVFVCSLNELTKTADEDDLAQNKRLLYVGMTRARELLYLTYHGVAPEWALAKLLPVLEQLSKRLG